MRTDKPIRYVKAWTSYLNDPLYYRLPFETRAVYWDLHLVSALTSDVPGWFVVGDIPLTLKELQHAAHATTPAQNRQVFEGMRMLLKTGLLQQHPTMGWLLPRWENDQAAYNRETAEESAARVRRWRRKQKEQAAGAQLRIIPGGQR